MGRPQLAGGPPSNRTMPGQQTSDSRRRSAAGEADLDLSPAGDAPASREGWEARLRDLAKSDQSANWELGDLLALGETRRWATYAEMAEMTGYDQGHLRNLVWVCRAVPPEIRDPELPWGVHKVMAARPEEERARLLADFKNAGCTRWSAPTSVSH
jgi:hypothetical protein